MRDNKKSNDGLKGFILGILTTLIVLGALFLVQNRGYLIHGNMTPTQAGARKKIADIYYSIDKSYLGKIDDDTLTDYMCAGLVQGLGDKYSTYYTQEQYEKIMQSAGGHYSGVGVAISKNNNKEIQIESVFENTPAFKAGIKPGDILLRVNDEDVTKLSVTEVVSRISKIKEGDVVSLTLKRDSASYQTDVTVEEVEAVSVSGKMLPDNTGYIRISEFTGVTSDQFKSAYKKLNEAGMTSLVIDLRSNPGGLVTGVCDTLRQILPKGVIVYTEDKYKNREEQKCDGKNPIDIPLAVLVNKSSASASEIFAGAVKDYEIGTVVGTVTYGKGVVQDTYQLKEGGALKLTVSHYFTPKGNNINGKGISPDVSVDLPENSSEDVQLDKALEVLKGSEEGIIR